MKQIEQIKEELKAQMGKSVKIKMCETPLITPTVENQAEAIKNYLLWMREKGQDEAKIKRKIQRQIEKRGNLIYTYSLIENK